MKIPRRNTSVRAVVVAASVLVTGLLVTVGPGTAGAGAQTDSCLPPPTLLYSEIAQVAGTNSQLWTDVQQVEQTDEAAGTSGSGQVIQDMLTVINRDGYQWDCPTDQLEATNEGSIPLSPGIPTIPDVSATTTPPSTNTSNPSAGVPGLTTTTGITGSAGITNTFGASAQVTSPLALAATPTTSSDGSGDLSTVALGLLALASASLLILVVRWQLRRR